MGKRKFTAMNAIEATVEESFQPHTRQEGCASSCIQCSIIHSSPRNGWHKMKKIKVSESIPSSKPHGDGENDDQCLRYGTRRKRD
ncbi:hypothetical protein PoB_000075300 [Plakobranchus ocellatus]|uniref:Uncharacterized protein n=1 Tax=Plakobranchus ocellatus TaxID=259542 RepID=A0AAV3XVD6_9GAST|nr:hypothetical protein PoB_000075300 [Plakobranchus ocellatus]